jgi:glycosyltransferase 2 family protein
MCHNRPMSPHSPQVAYSRRYLLLLGLLMLALYVIVPQFEDFRSSWHLLSQPLAGWVALAILFTSLTYFAAAGTYYFLAFKPLGYLETVLVQLAAMFINRLLPAGVGAVGANYVYLHKKEHDSGQAAAVVATNNLLGLTGHSALLSLVIAISGYSALSGTGPNASWVRIVAFGLAGLAGMALLALIFGRGRIGRVLKDVKTRLLEFRHRPARLGLAQLSSIVLTLVNVLCLYACALSLSVHLNFAVVFLIFSFGIGAATVTPTPGGLGGFEAALVAGFVAYKVDSSTALAIALLYRLISYWLPLAVGAFALVICQRRRLL